MKIRVTFDEIAPGEFRGRVVVDDEVLHEVVSFSKVGTMAALASASETELDDAIAIHTAVKASLQDMAVRDSRNEVMSALRNLPPIPSPTDGEN